MKEPTQPFCQSQMSDDPGDLFPALCAVRVDEVGDTHKGDHYSTLCRKHGISEPFEQYRWPNEADQQDSVQEEPEAA